MSTGASFYAVRSDHDVYAGGGLLSGTGVLNGGGSDVGVISGVVAEEAPTPSN